MLHFVQHDKPAQVRASRCCAGTRTAALSVVGQDAGVRLEGIASERAFADRTDPAERDLELEGNLARVDALGHTHIGRPTVAARLDAYSVFLWEHATRRE